jgi:hypothetical protein
MKTGIELIAEERKRQIEKERYDADHDSMHYFEDFAEAACCYAYPPSMGYPEGDIRGERWPWSDGYKPTPYNRLKELVKAGALIAAAIDRLQNEQP